MTSLDWLFTSICNGDVLAHVCLYFVVRSPGRKRSLSKEGPQQFIGRQRTSCIVTGRCLWPAHPRTRFTRRLRAVAKVIIDAVEQICTCKRSKCAMLLMSYQRRTYKVRVGSCCLCRLLILESEIKVRRRLH